MLLDLNNADYLCLDIRLHILGELHLSFWAYASFSELCQSWSYLLAAFPSSTMNLHVGSFVSTPIFGCLLLIVTEHHRQTVGLIHYLTLSEHVDGSHASNTALSGPRGNVTLIMREHLCYGFLWLLAHSLNCSSISIAAPWNTAPNVDSQGAAAYCGTAGYYIDGNKNVMKGTKCYPCNYPEFGICHTGQISYAIKCIRTLSPLQFYWCFFFKNIKTEMLKYILLVLIVRINIYNCPTSSKHDLEGWRMSAPSTN